MFYLKINEKIREYMNLIAIKLGCKYYCKYQLIALDEFELLRRELQNKKIKTIADEEFKDLIKSTEKVYFHSVHICQDDNSSAKEKIEEFENEGHADDELKKDKIYEKSKNPFVDFEKMDKDYELYQKQQETSERKPDGAKINAKAQSTLSGAISMIGSFFLLVLGSYYLGKYFFGFSDSATYKLVLVVTIIVFLSETILLLMKLNKETSETLTPRVIKEHSFAYKFNKKYRENFIDGNSFSKSKVFSKYKTE